MNISWPGIWPKVPFFPNFGEATVHCSYLVNLKPRGGGEGVTRPTFSFSKAKRHLSVGLRAGPSTGSRASSSSTYAPQGWGRQRISRESRGPRGPAPLLPATDVLPPVVNTEKIILSVKRSGSMRNYVVWEEKPLKIFLMQKTLRIGS